MAGWQIKFNHQVYKPLTLVGGDYRIRNRVLRPLRIGVPQAVQSHWLPLEVYFPPDSHTLIVAEGEEVRERSEESHFPGLDGIQGWEEKAVKVLKPLVEDAVEFLPLISKTGNFWAVNVLDVVDCLDHERSVLEYQKHLEAERRVLRIDKYVFQNGCLEGRHIFRMPEYNYARVFVSDDFKHQVEVNNLMGLEFIYAWD